MKRNVVRKTLGIISVTVLLAGPAIAQSVHGSGTTNVVPLWTNSSTIGNSVLSQSGSSLTASGSISATSFAGNGAALSNVNAASLGGILPSGFAQLGASSNAFSGSISATSFAGNGAALSNVNAASLGGILPSGFAQLGASSNAFAGSLSVGGTLSSYTVNSGNGGFQFAGTQVLSILPGLFNLYVGQSAGQGACLASAGTGEGVLPLR